MTDRKNDEVKDKNNAPSTREDLNDTGDGMPLAMGSGGYGGTENTVEKDRNGEDKKK